jgi:sigma-B regulation protein RsbU (phosphoserine phosphatase)
MFVTLLLAQLSHDHGTVHIVNAGNHPPLLVRAASKDLVTLGAPGLPLGIDPGVPYQATGELLLPGDFLLLHTDGLSDAYDSSQTLFGMERTRRVLLDHAESTAAELVEHLRLAVSAFLGPTPPYDDVTLLVARRIGGG